MGCAGRRSSTRARARPARRGDPARARRRRRRRDPERAPIPWRPPSAAGPGAGFTSGEPWLPLVAGAEDLCVERQADHGPRWPSTAVRPRCARPRRPCRRARSGCSTRARTCSRGCARRPASASWCLNFAAAEASLTLSSDRTLLLSTDPARGGPSAAGGRAPAGTRGGRRPAAGRGQRGAILHRRREPLRRPGRRGPVRGVDDVDHVPGVLGVAMLGFPSRIQSTSCMTSSKTCCSGARGGPR